MDLTGDLPVTLVIKAPSQRMDDQVVDCVLSWTVRKLKEHLETVYPSKPKSNEQRLIYSGRLLQDENMLKDVLKQYDGATDNRYTLHLVCSTPAGSPKPSKPSEKTKKPVTTSVPPQTAAQPTPTTVDGLRHRGSSQQQQPSQQTPASPATPPTSYGGYPAGAYNPYVPDAQAWAAIAAGGYATGYGGYPTQPYPATPEQYSPEQYNQAMQQMYAQYMMQYMQYYQTAYQGTPGEMPNPYMQAYAPAQPAHPAQPANPGAAAAPPVGANPAGDGARQNIRMNAQGGVEEDDEEEPRDWLHHTYFIMRFFTFLGILFFYSNLQRFLVVMAGFLFVLIAQKMKAAQRRREQRQREAAQAQAADAPPQAEPAEGDQEGVEPQDGEGDGAANSEDSANSDSPTDAADPANTTEPANPVDPTNPAEPAPPAPVGARLTRGLVFAYHTLETFITSLLPNPPELLEAN